MILDEMKELVALRKSAGTMISVIEKSRTGDVEKALANLSHIKNTMVQIELEGNQKVGLARERVQAVAKQLRDAQEKQEALEREVKGAIFRAQTLLDEIKADPKTVAAEKVLEELQAAKTARNTVDEKINAMEHRRFAAVNAGVVIAHTQLTSLIAAAASEGTEIVEPKTWPSESIENCRLLYADGVVSICQEAKLAADRRAIESEMIRLAQEVQAAESIGLTSAAESRKAEIEVLKIRLEKLGQ